MSEKVATAAIYTDMVAAGDICKVVKNGKDYQIYVFDKNQYVLYNPNMSFEESYRYLNAIYTAIYTINKNAVGAAMLRNHAVRVVIHNANRVFREKYIKGYEAHKNNEEDVDTILNVMSRSDRLKLTKDPEKSQLDCDTAKTSLLSAIDSLDIAISPSEFDALKAKYDREIQTNGSNPIKR